MKQKVKRRNQQQKFTLNTKIEQWNHIPFWWWGTNVQMQTGKTAKIYVTKLSQNLNYYHCKKFVQKHLYLVLPVRIYEHMSLYNLSLNYIRIFQTQIIFVWGAGVIRQYKMKLFQGIFWKCKIICVVCSYDLNITCITLILKTVNNNIVQLFR